MIILIASVVAILLLVSLGRLMAVNGIRTGSYTNPNVASKVVDGTVFDRNGKILSISTAEGRTYPYSNHGLSLIKETETLFKDVLSPHPGYEEATTYGENVFLTIDSDFQYLLDKAASDLKSYQYFDKAFGFIMDSATGEIMAILDSSLLSEVNGIKTSVIRKTEDINGKATDSGNSVVFSSDNADFLKIFSEKSLKKIDDKYLIFLGTSTGISRGIDQVILSLKAGLKSQSKI